MRRARWAPGGSRGHGDVGLAGAERRARRSGSYCHLVLRLSTDGSAPICRLDLRLLFLCLAVVRREFSWTYSFPTVLRSAILSRVGFGPPGPGALSLRPSPNGPLRALQASSSVAVFPKPSSQDPLRGRSSALLRIGAVTAGAISSRPSSQDPLRVVPSALPRVQTASAGVVSPRPSSQSPLGGRA